MSRLLIAASGTGGHLFPALAVADALPKSWVVSWLGVPDRLENKLVPSKYFLSTVRVGGLQGSWLRKIFRFLELIASIREVANLIRRQRIDIVFSTGGYIAAPAILAAKWCGVPVVLHESNAVPGRVTRFLGRFCDLVALGLSEADQRLNNCRTLVTGTPVRDAFLAPQSLPDWIPAGPGPLIVVMGGSQGSVGLNHMVRQVLPDLLKAGCRVVHLTGSNDLEDHLINHPNLEERSFSEEVPALFQHADLVVSRAGASALSELAICGTPTIFVPYPHATDNHQEANATSAAKYGAAVIVHQHRPEGMALGASLRRLLDIRISREGLSDDPLVEMRKGMKLLAVRDAQMKLVEVLQAFS